MVKIITVYDNNEFDSRLKVDWGFSCFIDHPSCKIIFDTGAKPYILENNLELLEINPKSIDYLIISHKHWDHKGGASWIIKQNPNITVLIPKTFTNGLQKEVSTLSNKVVVIDSSFEIHDKLLIFNSSNFFINELVLAIATKKGIALITGCSHTGVDRIAKTATRLFNQNIYALFGGFHLLYSSKKKIQKISDYLKYSIGIKQLSPCHCTGKIATEKLSQEFSEGFRKNGVGSQYLLEL